jgi:hypothetical protein
MSRLFLSKAQALELKRFTPGKLRLATEFRSGMNRHRLDRMGLIKCVESERRPEGNQFVYRLTEVGEIVWNDLRDWTPESSGYLLHVGVPLS